jgi:hypothetical protein
LVTAGGGRRRSDQPAPGVTAETLETVDVAPADLVAPPAEPDELERRLAEEEEIERRTLHDHHETPHFHKESD